MREFYLNLCINVYIDFICLLICCVLGILYLYCIKYNGICFENGNNKLKGKFMLCYFGYDICIFCMKKLFVIELLCFFC